MKARIKLRLLQTRMRSQMKFQRCAKVDKRIRRKVTAVAMLEAGVSLDKIAWDFAWPIESVIRLRDSLSALK
jgi:hypothetical protein